MKLKKKLMGVACVAAVLIAILVFVEAGADYSGSGLISPSCAVLAEENGMIKCGLKYGGIEFTKEDFTTALGTEALTSITVQELPPTNEGTLMLAGTYVVKNQVIPAENLGELKFVSSNDGPAESAFVFSANNNEYSTTCSLIFTESVNFAPSFSSSEALEVWTQRNIACFGTLHAKDPEGDALRYEIVSYPKKGLLTLDTKTGQYQFSPYANMKGVDSFEYCVWDSYGNRSEIVTVAIEIDRAASNLVFVDMQENPAHNAAILATAENHLNYTEVNGKYYFSPNETVSREDFLVMTMNLFGAKNVPEIKSSGFTDDSEISTNAKGYVASAYFLGIVSGDIENGKIYFRPQDAITKAEAAVMVNNILGFEPTVSASTFSDADEIPVWAESSLCALTELGILKTESTGNIGANDTLTKAQVAQIIMSLIQYTGKQ